MKKLMKPKIVWGLLVLVVISSLLVIKNVKAEEVITGDEAKKICDEFLPSIKYLSRYNVTFDEKSAQSNRYVIKMNPTSSDKNLEKALRKVKFKVILINGQGVSENMELAYGKPLEVEGKFIKDDSEDGLGIDIMRVTLEATETNSDPKCLGKVSFTVLKLVLYTILVKMLVLFKKLISGTLHRVSIVIKVMMLIVLKVNFVMLRKKRKKHQYIKIVVAN